MTTLEKKKYRLEEIAFFQEGPGLRNWQWTPDGMKVINGTNILLSGQVDTSNTDKFISLLEFESRYKHFAINDGDLVLTSSGTLGKVGRIRSENLPLMMNTSVIRFRSKNPKILLDDYLHCYLRSPEFQAKIRSFAVGGAQQNFGPSHLKQISLSLPTLRVQAAIAETVTSYDDLIENNRRRIALLEQSARLLYREWFVHLRFPGHEHVKVVDGVPEGWERTTLGDVAENHDRLRVPLSVLEREKRQGAYPYYGAASLLDHVDGYLFDGRYLLLGEDGTVVNSEGAPMLQLVEGKFWVNNHAHVLTGKKAGLEFLYCCLSAYKIQGHITGVAQPKITQANMNRIPVLIPSESVMTDFQSSVKASFDQRFVLERLNDTLRKARDLLLPRLMSGDLVV